MWLITGAAGFVGSCMVGFLNKQGINDLLLADNFEQIPKWQNLKGKQFYKTIDRELLFEYLQQQKLPIQKVIHLGARTDTTDANPEIFQHLNFDYSKKIWNFCTQHQIPLVYASSAATYGNGHYGYNDTHDLPPLLQPLNQYGKSKNDFDCWALTQHEQPPRWYGLKFFNVYGPNEYHKNRMASVVFHAFQQIKKQQSVSLFRSHRPDFEDGQQLRDFIYVKDVVAICHFLAGNQLAPSGLYNVGTGQARSFNDLAKSVFDAMQLPTRINYIDTPSDIRENYQYFTQANMDKLLQLAQYSKPSTSLEQGIEEYVCQYLMYGLYW